MNPTVYYDVDTDPANPGWVLEYTSRYGQRLTEPLDATDAASAVAEAAAWLEISPGMIRVEA